jgi:metallo-beta-lactamase superfamily protein
MPLKYVSPFETTLKTDRGRSMTLIWGDPCHVLGAPANGKVRVRARGQEGLVAQDALSDTGLLEMYVIDVGQGDGILLRTPDDRWHMIDAGIANEEQMLRRGAPNFLRWKFRTDLRLERVPLENVILSHADFDHFGGFIDILSGRLGAESLPVDVANLYHPGIGRFADAPKLGAAVPGRVPPFPRGDRGIRRDGRFITELLSGKTSFRDPPRPLTESFSAFARAAANAAGRVRRLSAADEFLPGYEAGELVIRVLGPIEERLEGGGGLRVLGGDSITVNGHSIVLRLDYHQARILLTGDLNTKSQRLLLSYVPETTLRRRRGQGLPPRGRGHRSRVQQGVAGPRDRHLLRGQRELLAPAPARARRLGALRARVARPERRAAAAARLLHGAGPLDRARARRRGCACPPRRRARQTSGPASPRSGPSAATSSPSAAYRSRSTSSTAWSTSAPTASTSCARRSRRTVATSTRRSSRPASAPERHSEDHGVRKLGKSVRPPSTNSVCPVM